MPDEVLASARAAFRQRARHEVATLVFDSMIDEGAPPEDHWLRFEHPSLGVDIHVTVADARRRLSCAFTPAVEGRAQLRLDGSGEILADEIVAGAAHFDRVPTGLVRVTVLGPGLERPVITDWFRV